MAFFPQGDGVNMSPEDGYVFSFPDVEFSAGTLSAVGRDGGKMVAEQKLTTASQPAQIKLTSILGPLGLQADGQDSALIDVQVVDARGATLPDRRCEDRLHLHGTGHLARRLQQRQT